MSRKLSTLVGFARGINVPVTYLPVIHNDVPISGQSTPRMSPLAQEFAVLWLEQLGTRAALMVLDDRLVTCAMLHAEYLHSRTGDQLLVSMHRGRNGSYANQRALEAGYLLPLEYAASANNIESCAREANGAQAALDGLLASEAHGPHLRGEDGFSDRTHFGIGAAGDDFVVVICPPEQISV